MSATTYKLTAEDVEPGLDYDDPPAIRAAANPNPQVLKAVLRHGWQQSPYYNLNDSSLAAQYGPNAFLSIPQGGGDSPLLCAIRCRLTENVDTLLEAGADPNGLAIWMLEDSVNASTASLSYQRPDTPGNIHSFWFSAISHFQVDKLKTQSVVAVEAAAAKGLNDTIDKLVVRGADISSWLLDPLLPPPGQQSPSSLSASSPLHAAVSNGHAGTLAHLLSPPLSLNPNFLASGSPVRRLTPAMRALCLTPPNLDCLSVLIASPSFDASIRTPDSHVCLGHFAVAHHSPELFRYFMEKLPSIFRESGVTVHGHTILHVACMPRDETQLNVFAPRVYQSIRFVNSLDPEWKPTKLYATCPYQSHSTAQITPSSEPPLFAPPDERLFDAQAETLEFLRNIHTGEDDGGVWGTARNRWGYTPRDLFEDGVKAVEGRHMKFWNGTFNEEGDPRMPCYGCASSYGGRGTGRGRGRGRGL
ncbi:ANK-REP-region domain-containing protein [Favolaschia claudopus]|uniref:ANK-REP-region domain-containing protein n=1 Tax=Favolaschia claudopus TaxID=2862362 RepID=A0AAW0BG33_9AGAR